MKIVEIYNTDENIGPAPKGVCSKPMSTLPASWVSSCKSQGKMKRTGNRDEKVGGKTMKVSGKRIKGKKVVEGLPKPVEKAVSDFLEQACVVGLTTPQPIALVNLSENGLKKNQNQIRSELKVHIDVVNQNLANYEKISTIIITKEVWSEHNKLLTPTLKVKRNKIDEKYMNNYSQWHQDNCSIVWKN